MYKWAAECDNPCVSSKRAVSCRMEHLPHNPLHSNSYSPFHYHNDPEIWKIKVQIIMKLIFILYLYFQCQWSSLQSLPLSSDRREEKLLLRADRLNPPVRCLATRVAVFKPPAGGKKFTGRLLSLLVFIVALLIQLYPFHLSSPAPGSERRPFWKCPREREEEEEAVEAEEVLSSFSVQQAAEAAATSTRWGERRYKYRVSRMNATDRYVCLCADEFWLSPNMKST